MKYLAILLLTLTGCSSIKRELDSAISPTGAYYDLPENQPTPYVDTRTPEQIAADKEEARKYVEEDDAKWKASHFANPVNAPKK